MANLLQHLPANKSRRTRNETGDAASYRMVLVLVQLLSSGLASPRPPCLVLVPPLLPLEQRVSPQEPWVAAAVAAVALLQLDRNLLVPRVGSCQIRPIARGVVGSSRLEHSVRRLQLVIAVGWHATELILGVVDRPAARCRPPDLCAR